MEVDLDTKTTEPPQTEISIKNNEASSPPKTKKKGKNSQRRLIQLLIAALVLSAFLIFVIISKPGDLSVPNIDNGVDPAGPPMTFGSPNAKVVINEFSDFQCVSCAQFAARNEKYLIEDYVLQGSVRLVFHPTARLGTESEFAAEAAFCAADQKRFWQYKDILFTYQTGVNQGGFSQAKLIEYAAKVKGLNLDTFKTCLASGQHASDIEAGPQPAAYDGSNDVLVLRVNSHILTSQYEYAELQNLIEEVLNH